VSTEVSTEVSKAWRRTWSVPEVSLSLRCPQALRAYAAMTTSAARGAVRDISQLG